MWCDVVLQCSLLLLACVVVIGAVKQWWWLLVAQVTQRRWVVATMVVVVEKESLFVDVVYMLFLANAAYAAQYKDTMVAYMIYYIKS